MNLNSILVGSEDPGRLIAYYSAVFGTPRMAEEEWATWQIGSGYLSVGPHSEVKGKNVSPGRILWNVITGDVEGEFTRLRDAGATVVREPYRPDEAPEMWIATFSDPDGNYFQLMSPMEDE